MDFSELEGSILFEDEELLVINKPAGWVVNRSKTYDGPTIQDWMETKIKKGKGKGKEGGPEVKGEYGTPEEIMTERTGIVHRLDKETSGVMVLAKTPETLVALMAQFKERETKKVYVALVHGKLVPAEGVIRVPLGRSEHDKLKFSISVDGKMSETQYKVKEYFPGLPKGMHQKKGKSYQGFTLVELTPKTGRTHQIRVHMSATGHPLVGDETYAGKKRIVLDMEWCPRHFLHAKELCFAHPITREERCFEAQLPEDLKAALKTLQSEE